MKELIFEKLKTTEGYNVILGEDVVGRMTLFSSQYKLPHTNYFPKGYEKMEKNSGEQVYERGSLKIDGKSRRCFLGKKEYYLAVIPFRIVYTLASQGDKCFNRAELYEIVYGDSDISSNKLDVHIKNIRVKLGFDLIETLRGIGYRIKI